VPKSQEKYLTTGQAAKLCSVTPDAMLKWIKLGKIPAHRTAGGHYRVARESIQHLLAVDSAPAGEASAAVRSFQYCWEYNAGDGEALEECTQCVVFRTRAHRCYEVIKLAGDIGHARQFCEQTCDTCDYFQRVHLQATNVLVVSGNRSMTAALQRQAREVPLNLEVADSEYTTSALVETFRPDYAIVDCDLGSDQSQEIVRHLKQDPRLPYVRVVLAAGSNGLPGGCDREVFGRIRTPISIQDIVAVINGIRTTLADGELTQS
jgi:excisionase family DNA binding protein